MQKKRNFQVVVQPRHSGVSGNVQGPGMDMVRAAGRAVGRKAGQISGKAASALEAKVAGRNKRIVNLKEEIAGMPTQAAVVSLVSGGVTAYAAKKIEEARVKGNSEGKPGYVGANADMIYTGLSVAGSAVVLAGVYFENLSMVVGGAQVAGGAIAVKAALAPHQIKTGADGKYTIQGPDESGNFTDGPQALRRNARRAIAAKIARQCRVETGSLEGGVDTLEEHLEGSLRDYEDYLQDDETGLIPGLIAQSALPQLAQLLAKFQIPAQQAKMQQVATQTSPESTSGTPGLDTFLLLQGFPCSVDGSIIDETGKLFKSKKERTAAKLRKLQKKERKLEAKNRAAIAKDWIKSGELVNIVEKLQSQANQSQPIVINEATPVYADEAQSEEYTEGSYRYPRLI